MSAHQLPDDVSRWPDDAYELLGVERGTDPRELRRAYTRLIRTYKPEQYPEQFRRIREAYESVLRYAELFGHFDSDSSPEAETPVQDAGDRGARPEAADSEETQTAPAPYRLPDVPEIWKTACDGDTASAYRRLVQLDETEPGQTDVCLAAYWLLVLEPTLDKSREPCDWLARGLEAARLTGPLRELYRRELAENPAEALTDRCTRLLRAAAGAGSVADFAEWRWRAAARLDRLAIVEQDLDCLRPRLVQEDEETWLRLLLVAAGLLIHAPDLWPTQKELQQEIDRHEHLHHRLGYAFDQYEFQKEVGQGLGSHIPPIIRELVVAGQEQSFAEVRPRLLTFLEEWTPQPSRLLRCFDAVRKAAPAVLAELGNLLQQLADSVPPCDDDRDQADYAELTETFLAGLTGYDAEKFRLQLLDFCLREAVSPQWASDSMAAKEFPTLAHQVREDAPLQHTWLACQVMGR